MAIRKLIFGSKSERSHFEHLRSVWGDRFHVHTNLPFLQVCDTAFLKDESGAPFSIDYYNEQRLKKTSIDYVVADHSGAPLVAVDFDGLQEGFNFGTNYRPREGDDEWRNLNCVDAVAKGGLDVLGDALTRRVQELRFQHQQLTNECQRRRQALVACETAIYDEQRIRQSIEQLGALLPRLSPEERKELVRLFVLRVELRNPTTRTQRTNLGEAQDRRLSLKIKLSLPELVQGVETRDQLSSGWASRQRPIAPRGVSFDARVDFTHAMKGEVIILTPFQQVFRNGAVAPRKVSYDPKVQHAIVRARKWQQMLEAGKVANRLALAKRLGITPGAVTRILKLLEVMPDIQRFLESLNTKEANRHFTIKKVGDLADLSPSEQLIEFGKMRAAFAPQRNQ